MQGKGVKIDTLLEMYKNEVTNLTNEVIFLRAYVKELEDQLKQYQEKDKENDKNKK